MQDVELVAMHDAVDTAYKANCAVAVLFFFWVEVLGTKESWIAPGILSHLGVQVGFLICTVYGHIYAPLSKVLGPHIRNILDDGHQSSQMDLYSHE